MLVVQPTASQPVSARHVAVARAVAALAWAAALLLAVGDRVPRTDSDVPLGAAVVLTTYPLIDAIASLLAARTPVLRVNAAVSALAVVAVGAAAFGSDAAATLVAFGAWAAVSGALLLGVTLRGTRRLPLLVSGGLSTLAGLSFIAAAGKADAHLGMLAGYMALGAVLFLAGARRRS